MCVCVCVLSSLVISITFLSSFSALGKRIRLWGFGSVTVTFLNLSNISVTICDINLFFAFGYIIVEVSETMLLSNL